jgi:coatomer subunit beta'
VHPNLPYVLTSSDDMLIKLWDWDKGWACCQVFEGHSHYVMQVRRRDSLLLAVGLTE